VNGVCGEREIADFHAGRAGRVACSAQKTQLGSNEPRKMNAFMNHVIMNAVSSGSTAHAPMTGPRHMRERRP
jgi:hypothetical protein